MLRPSYLAISFAFALSACGGETPSESDDGEAISVEEVAERAAASDMKPEPGLYTSSVEVLEINVPGAPDNLAEMMRSSMGMQDHEYCLTEADVERGFEEMARQSQESEECEFNRFDVDGGDIDAQMTCDIEGQGRMVMTMTGTGNRTSSVMNMTMRGNMAGMGETTMRMKATHERIGDCPA